MNEEFDTIHSILDKMILDQLIIKQHLDGIKSNFDNMTLILDQVNYLCHK